MSIFLATQNHHKIDELNAMAGDIVRFQGLDGFQVNWDETGNTFRENALIKATATMNAVGAPVLADDSGLEVDALDGRPGVHTARFAGENASDEENYQLLLTHLNEIENRDARFVCTLCFLEPGKSPLYFEGELSGSIAKNPSGSDGFGYDPVFYLPGRDCTLSELSAFEKNLISHRYCAMQKFLAHMKSLS